MPSSAMDQPSLPRLFTKAVGATLKAFTANWFMPRQLGGWPSLLLGTTRTDINYAAAVGDGLASSVVMPVIQWIQRTLVEAPLVVRRRVEDELEIIQNHPLALLVERPNAFYSGTLLWMATVYDFTWFGESYWRILPNVGGQPGELWWLPPWSIEPKWPADGSEFISHYEYHPEAGTKEDLALTEVLHFRHGLDPRNPRHGLPPLRAVLRDIYTDDEASLWVASLLRNMGIPGLILSPDSSTQGMFVGPEEIERMKAYVRARFTGDQRGEPLVLGAPIKVEKLSFNPNEMDMAVVRGVAEQRVTSALGIPAAVIGFGTGLENSKVGATMAQFVRLAWTQGIIPMQRLLAAELQRVLLPQFERNMDRFLVGHDYDEVEALQESRDDLAQRYQILVGAGILTVAEAREALGYESTPEDDIYLRPSSLTPTDPKDQMPEPILPDTSLMGTPSNGNGAGSQNGNGNGNGNGARTEERALVKQGASLDQLLVQALGNRLPRMNRIPPGLQRLGRKLWNLQTGIQQRFEPKVKDVLARYAEAAATAAREVLRPQKASVENMIRTAIVHERLPLAQVRFELEAVYREMYSAILKIMEEILEEAGQAPLTDAARVERHLRTLAMERTTLLDLTTEARSAILDTLEKATAAGLSEEDMVAAIKDAVPRGRWRSIEQRAEIIVRQESRVAMNMSSAGYAREHNLRLLVLDSQLGSFDEECDSRVGWIVTPEQAERIARAEHVSGTYQAVVIPNQVDVQSEAATT